MPDTLESNRERAKDGRGGAAFTESKLRLAIALAFVVCSASLAEADCSADLDAIMQSTLHAGPYHMSMTSDAGGKTTTIEADVILPTSEHLKMAQMEMIILPQGAWMKRGGKWLAAPGTMGSSMLSGVTSSYKDTRSNVVCGSSEDFEGQSYPVFTYDSSGEAIGIATTSHVKLYKGENGLPVGLVVDGTAMGVHSVTTQHITYDPSITIEPPK